MKNKLEYKNIKKHNKSECKKNLKNKTDLNTKILKKQKLK